MKGRDGIAHGERARRRAGDTKDLEFENRADGVGRNLDHRDDKGVEVRARGIVRVGECAAMRNKDAIGNGNIFYELAY